MRLTPRKSEVEAIASILATDESYDTLEDMAKDIIEAVAGEFTKRDWHAYGAKMGELTIGWGPFPSEVEARKFGEKLALGLPSGIVKLYSPAGALERLAESEATGKGDCASCGHPRGLHEHPKMAYKCALKTCDCGGFK